MLTELHIQNFAIIDKLDLRFDSGLIILTGETGAGKSIIMDALELVLGNRTDGNVVRKGAERTEIAAIFEFYTRFTMRPESAVYVGFCTYR